MRLFCKCGNQLMIRHDIKLDVMSNFTYVDGKITITKHEVAGTKGLKPFFDESEIKSAYCRSCNSNVEFAESLYRCDNCGNNVIKDDVKNLGDTLIICPRCLKGVENFEVFKIFGQRGPSSRTRNKRIEEAVDSAREAMPELPDEIIGMLSGEEPTFSAIDFVATNTSTTGTSGDTDNV